MRKIAAKDIVDFIGKSNKAKINFVHSLKKPNVNKISDGGGHYWISCLSAISNSFKTQELKHIQRKLLDLKGKIKTIENEITKTRYKRNLDILNKYKNFDLLKWHPSERIKILVKQKENLIINVKGLKIKVSPNHVFNFKQNGIEHVGSIWFVAKLNGYRDYELGIFTEILFLYLRTHYSNDFIINSKYCIAVDIYNNYQVNYSSMENNKTPYLLNSTLEEISSLI